MGFPGGSVVKKKKKKDEFDPWIETIPWRRKFNHCSTLVGDIPWREKLGWLQSRKESDMT